MAAKMDTRSRKAYTMIEIMIVIIIIGLLAALGLPRLTKAIEVQRSTEGITAVQTFHAAMLRYNVMQSIYPTDCTKLDVTMVPKNFNNLQCTAAGSVSMDRAGKYTLTETAAGVFSCSNIGATAYCAYLNLPN